MSLRQVFTEFDWEFDEVEEFTDKLIEEEELSALIRRMPSRRKFEKQKKQTERYNFIDLRGREVVIFVPQIVDKETRRIMELVICKITKHKTVNINKAGATQATQKSS
ncbi:hypothetical protein POM88_017749 [Heracleum sosnowskyi]|uniref:Uncharacterized protein n=1 Tax=Heracleum sosnowskyi TaxID=360622 RepID=A0AAD8IQ09_9APIA|nr:hypothetical protein POM88_017749 [Heracleum sosnowskyi]